MRQYLTGALSALLLVGGGLVLWQALSASPPVATSAPPSTADNVVPIEAPAASDKTREEKRFARYDKDKDGKVTREEFIASRRKAFLKLDTDGDGRLTFDEWAIKTSDRFKKADTDKSAALTPAEFETTRIARKASAAPPCVPDAD